MIIESCIYLSLVCRVIFSSIFHNMKSASTLPLAATVPQQERRSLRVRYRGGGGISGNSGSGGGETANARLTIIIVVVCTTAVALLVLGCGFWKWSSRKKVQNPNWRCQDYFKRRTSPAAELKTEAMLHETRLHDAEEVAAPVAHDNPRANLGSKSRKQAAASHES